ncbi:calcium binding hemolysin protein [Actinobacillus equuli]|nr:calcium binding hemolysin protein [Actinobacillus equuli]
MTTVFTKGQGSLTVSTTENIQLAGYKATDLSASMFSRLANNLVITLDSRGSDKIIVTNYLTETDSTLTIQFDDVVLTSMDLDTYIANNAAITIYTGYDGTNFPIRSQLLLRVMDVVAITAKFLG